MNSIKYNLLLTFTLKIVYRNTTSKSMTHQIGVQSNKELWGKRSLFLRLLQFDKHLQANLFRNMLLIKNSLQRVGHVNYARIS
jgi:hypothetical protein